MELTVAVSILICLALGCGLVQGVRGVTSAGAAFPETADWIEELSVERYHPMLRLLNEDELAFLRSQPGFTPQLASQYRHQRCQIFRGYLGCLGGDFHRLVMAVQVLMLQAGADRSDLASLLVRNWLAFAGAMGLARVRLVLYRFGIGRVNAAGLLSQFDGMRLALCARVPSAMFVGA